MAFQANADSVLWQVLDDEAVIIQVDSSEYYGLNAAGTLLWERLVDGPRSEHDLEQTLEASCQRADVDVSREVTDFLRSLSAASLVVETETAPADEGGSGGAEPPPERPTAVTEPPEVSRLGELETLLLSGE